VTRRVAPLAGLCAVALLAVGVGGTPLGPSVVLHALFAPHAAGDATTIVWSLRLPRVAIAATVGATLSLAGYALQALLRNPLVDAYLTGVSAGAGAAIAIAATLGVAVGALPALGFASGLATAVLVAALARRGASMSAERLILAGVSISALMSAFVALALTRLAHGPASDAILAWLAGSLAGRGWNDLAAALPYAIVGALTTFAIAPALGVLRLGDLRARSLGLDVARTQWIILAAAALLTAAAVSLAGLVGFVGLIVPHLARRIEPADVRAALVTTAILGATLVVVADALSRVLFAPLEIPLGVLLAFVGVPAFLLLYLRDPSRARA
jgi:iron complex transport system permease protein